MGYPRLYREIEDMARDTAIETKMARAIARKAGLRQGTAETPPDVTTRTLIDAYIDSNFSTDNYQWDVDLTGFTRIRLVTRSIVEVVLWYSVDGFGSQDLNPGDYEVFPADPPYEQYFTVYVGAYIGNSEISVSFFHNGIGWAGIPPALRRPLRLSIAHLSAWPLVAGWGDTEDNAQGFSLAVEAR